MTDPRPSTDWRPLALTLAVLTTAYVVAYRLMPYDMSGRLLWPFGAWAMYVGARLTTRVGLPLVICVFAMTDVVLYQRTLYPPNYIYYPCLGFSMLIGRGLLAHSQAVWRVVSGGLASYVVFFLVSNFAAWLEGALPEYSPHTLDSLLLCYRNGLDFLRYQPGTIVGLGDVLPGLILFGAHAYLAKAYFPAERVVAETAR